MRLRPDQIDVFGTDDGWVHVQFPEPCNELSMPIDEAMKLAETIRAPVARVVADAEGADDDDGGTEA